MKLIESIKTLNLEEFKSLKESNSDYGLNLDLDEYITLKVLEWLDNEVYSNKDKIVSTLEEKLKEYGFQFNDYASKDEIINEWFEHYNDLFTMDIDESDNSDNIEIFELSKKASEILEEYHSDMENIDNEFKEIIQKSKHRDRG